MSSSGALTVNDHMQVKGFTNIYAVGDCADVDEPKMAYHAALHADVAVNNIANSVSGKKLKSYSTGKHVHVSSVQQRDGLTRVTNRYHHHAVGARPRRRRGSVQRLEAPALARRAGEESDPAAVEELVGDGTEAAMRGTDTHSHTHTHQLLVLILDNCLLSNFF